MASENKELPRVYLVIRRDLNMSPGKLAVQVGHGIDYVHTKKTGCYREWMEASKRRKIVVSVADAVKEADVDRVIEVICKAAGTGKIGDGKIFVTDLLQVVRIRTGETDESAI